MTYESKVQLENAKNLQKALQEQLDKINDDYDNGDEEAMDNLFDNFSIKINDKDISLGSMDVYASFCKFLDEIIQSEEDES
jgi:D-serine dehydratase